MTEDHIGRAVPGLSQPIESAPRDGEIDILGSTLGRVWFQCFWDEETERWYTFNSYAERAEMARSGEPWEFKPTMWMPIPDPPEVTG